MYCIYSRREVKSLFSKTVRLPVSRNQYFVHRFKQQNVFTIKTTTGFNSSSNSSISTYLYVPALFDKRFPTKFHTTLTFANRVSSVNSKSISNTGISLKTRQTPTSNAASNFHNKAD